MRAGCTLIVAAIIVWAAFMVIPKIFEYYSPLQACFRAVYERNLEVEHELMCTVIFGDYEPV